MLYEDYASKSDLNQLRTDIATACVLNTRTCKRDIDSLLHIVRDGNGGKPLTRRFDILEKDVQSILAKLEEFASIKKQLLLAIIGGCIGIAASVITASIL
jgi:DNA replicative helicase MCM subunit Mcm2 (Cdc46/Mcm family)